MKIGVKVMHCLLRALSALPLGFHYAWAGFFAWVMKDILHYRRDEMMINLARSFPEKKYSDLKKIAARFYRHFGEIVAETIWFGGCRREERLRRRHLVEMTNPEVIDEAFRNSKGGVMILDSHCGNWELTGGYLCYDYRPGGERPYSVPDIKVIYKPLESGFWNEIMRLNRCAPVLQYDYDGYISSKELLRFALSHKEKKHVYLIPADQYPYWNSTSQDVIEFMHQPTRTMLGGASIACKLGMSVFYMNLCPVSKGHYEWTFTEICPDASAMTPHEIMVRFYALLQQDVERIPWNYLWTHKRWK